MTDELTPAGDATPEVQRALIELRTWAAAAPEYDAAAGARRFRAGLGLPPEPPEPSEPSDPGSGTQAGGGSKASVGWISGGAVAAVLIIGAAVVGMPKSPSPSAAAETAARLDAQEPEPLDTPAPVPTRSQASTASGNTPGLRDATAGPSASPSPERAMLDSSSPEPAASPSAPSQSGPSSRSDDGRDPSPRAGRVDVARRGGAPQPEVPSEADSSTTAVVPSELTLVREMRAAIDREPIEALRVADTLDRHHPRGLLMEERQALRVLALHAAGRRGGAQAEGRHFLSAHPGSAFAGRIRAIVEGDEKDVAADEASGVDTQGGR